MKHSLLMLALFTSFTVSVGEANAVRSKNVEQSSFRHSIEQAADSVVSIYASKTVASLEDNIDAALYSKMMINQVLSENEPNLNLKKENSMGSGVIVSKDGLIVTNRHIVDGAIEIRVVTLDEQQYKASLIATDDVLDLAILKIVSNKTNFPVVKYSDSDDVYIGDRVFALGNPFGIGQSVSSGIISAVGRSNLGSETGQYLIQTDAAINPGNSGGALIDVDGKLVGLNSAMFSQTEAFSGVGFAVPSNAIKFAVDTLVKTGSIKKAWLGVNGENISKDTKRQLNLKSLDGLYITKIYHNSPAYKANLKAGDILLKIGSKKVKNKNLFDSIMQVQQVNEGSTLTVLRNARVLTLEVVFKAIEKRAESNRFIIRGNNFLKGLVVETLNADFNSSLNLPINKKGLAVVDRPNTITSLNILINDVILEINKTKIVDLKTLESVLNTPNPYGWTIKLLRNGKEIKIFIK